MQYIAELKKNGKLIGKVIVETSNKDEVQYPRSMAGTVQCFILATDTERSINKQRNDVSAYSNSFSYQRPKNSIWEPNKAFNGDGKSNKYVMAKIIEDANGNPVLNAKFQTMLKSKVHRINTDQAPSDKAA